MFFANRPRFKQTLRDTSAGIGYNYQHLDRVATSFPFWESLQSPWPDPQQPQDRVKEQLAQQGPKWMILANTLLPKTKVGRAWTPE